MFLTLVVLSGTHEGLMERKSIKQEQYGRRDLEVWHHDGMPISLDKILPEKSPLPECHTKQKIAHSCRIWTELELNLSMRIVPCRIYASTFNRSTAVVSGIVTSCNCSQLAQGTSDRLSVFCWFCQGLFEKLKTLLVLLTLCGKLCMKRS